MSGFIKETSFFTLTEISEGIYAAIAKAGQGAWSNAGIVDLGNELLVFDSFSTPSAGQELRLQAETITGKKVKYLINSHFHGDHVFGNDSFKDTTIISTSLTREWFKEKNRMTNLDSEIKETESYLEELQRKIDRTEETMIKESLKHQYSEMKKVLEDLPILKLVLPSLIFEERLTIEGSKRKIELYCLGGGHTPSDTFMYIPEEKVAFMGDLATEKLHVPIYNPVVFRRILTKVKSMDIKTVVPGHGNVSDMELLETIDEYIAFLIEKCHEALTKRQPLEALISDFQLPERYKDWRGINGIKGNLSTVYSFYESGGK